MKQQPISHRRERLRDARLRRHWSQQDVADQLNVTVVTISRWEQGVTTPSFYFLRQLCALFELSATELDLDPHKETTSLDISVDQTPFLLDPVLPSFQQEQHQLIGRQKEIQHIAGRLCSLQGGTYALTGLPGVGKTALTIALAHHPQVRQHFLDGILWVGLGPTPHVIDSLSRWGSLLGLNASEVQTLTTADAWAKYLHQRIGNRRLLLILDDAWDLAEAVIFHLGGSQCTHLLTTRFPSLAYAFAREQVTILHELTETDSLALLHQLVPQAFEEHLPELRELAQTVGGLPLALLLLGHALQVQVLSGPPRRLSQALHELNQNMHARLQMAEPLPSWKEIPGYTAGSPISLQLAIAMSVRQLPDAAQETLRALAVFPPKPYSFSEAAALAVCHTSVQMLDTLIDSGLVEPCSAGRYQIHQTIADYARLQASDPVVENRLVMFFLHFVCTHQEDTQALEQELYIITQVFQLAFLRQLYKPFLQGMLALLPFLERRRLYGLADTLLTQGQEAALALDDQLSLTHIWLARGKMAELRGAFLQAQQAFVEGLGLARKLGQQELLAHFLVSLGGTLVDTETAAQAERFLVEGLQVIEELDDNALRCLVFQYLGELADNMGEMKKATVLYQQGLALARQTQNWKIASALLQDLGTVEARRGMYQEAERLYQEGLAYAKQQHDQQRQSALFMCLGMLAWHQHQEQKAVELSLESLRLAREIEQQMRISSALQNLGMMMREQHQLLQAEAYLQESLALARHIGHRWLITETLGEWGKLQLKQGYFAQARVTFDEMHEQAQEMNAPLFIALALFGLAQVAEHEGAREQTLAYIQTSKTILDELHNRVLYQEIEDWCTSVLLSPEGTNS